MLFQNREDAARQLAKKLEPYRKDHPLILGIPRGAVPMAALIADFLEGDLDVVLVHKIGAPFQKEYAIGSVSEMGHIEITDQAVRSAISDGDFKQLVEEELEVLNRRKRIYRAVHPALSPAGRTVIIVDDGVATGSTMMAAVHAIRSQKPQKIIVAAPVASHQAEEVLGGEADSLVFVEVPQFFGAVGSFYDEFSQVTEEEVIHLLAKERRAS